MEKRSASGWLRFDENEQMEALERSLTPTLSVWARNPDHLDLVREQCRRRVAEFVRSWLLLENQWGPKRFTSVTVVFADEKEADPSALPPTVIEGGD
jgi:hypothetical protein